MPPGFIVNRGLSDPSYAMMELNLGASIALGEHGFGSLFTPKAPFVVVCIGDPNAKGLSTEHLRAEVKNALNGYGNAIRVDGFTAPDGR